VQERSVEMTFVGGKLVYTSEDRAVSAV